MREGTDNVDPFWNISDPLQLLSLISWTILFPWYYSCYRWCCRSCGWGVLHFKFWGLQKGFGKKQVWFWPINPKVTIFSGRGLEEELSKVHATLSTTGGSGDWKQRIEVFLTFSKAKVFILDWYFWRLSAESTFPIFNVHRLCRWSDHCWSLVLVSLRSLPVRWDPNKIFSFLSLFIMKVNSYILFVVHIKE